MCICIYIYIHIYIYIYYRHTSRCGVHRMIRRWVLRYHRSCPWSEVCRGLIPKQCLFFRQLTMTPATKKTACGYNTT